jgi:hypothetical protein
MFLQQKNTSTKPMRLKLLIVNYKALILCNFLHLAINTRRSIPIEVPFHLPIPMDETSTTFIWPRNVSNGRHIQDLQVLHALLNNCLNQYPIIPLAQYLQYSHNER